jgi:hypothetical protein
MLSAPGLVNTISVIYKEEGFRALYKGLTPFVTHLTGALHHAALLLCWLSLMDCFAWHMIVKYALRLGAFGAMQNALAKSNDGKTSPLRTLAVRLRLSYSVALPSAHRKRAAVICDWV